MRELASNADVVNREAKNVAAMTDGSPTSFCRRALCVCSLTGHSNENFRD